LAIKEAVRLHTNIKNNITFPIKNNQKSPDFSTTIPSHERAEGEE
jgi:hypothetical protein